MSRVPSVLISALALAAAIAATPAYAYAQRAQSGGPGLPALWDALSAAPTVAAVQGIALPAVEEGSAQDDLIEGMVRLRTYELTLDRTHAFIGKRNLERAIERSPDDVWAHYMLGVMLARGPDVRSREYQEKYVFQPRQHSNAAAGARRALLRAISMDSSFDAAVLEYATLANDISDRAMMKDAVKLLTTGTRATNGRALLLAAKLQNRLKQPDQAERLARAAADRGFDRSITALERATALFRSQGSREAATKIYFDGLSSLSAEGADAYFANMSMLVNEAEARQWYATSLDRKGAWLRKFWDRYAALAGLSIQRRLAEHFLRAELIENSGVGVQNPVTVARQVDTTRVTPNFITAILGIKGMASIVTIKPEMVNIVRHGDATRTGRFLYCAPGWDSLPVPMQPTLQDCMRSPFGRMRAKNMNRIYMWQGTERSVIDQSYYPDYNRHIALTWEALQFRAAGGGAEIVASVGVRGRSAAALRNNDGDLEPVVTLTLVDTAQDWIRRKAATTRVRVGDITEDQLFLFHVAATAPADTGVELRVAVENAAATAGAIAYGRIDIDAFHPDSLTMSSVVLSPEDASGSFVRGDVRVALAPGRAYRAETPTLYYEVYGATAGSELRTEIRLEPVRASVLDRMRSVLGRDDGAITFSFSEPAGETSAAFGLQQTREVSLHQLVPGAYRLRVTVTEMATGRSATRATQLDVIE